MSEPLPTDPYKGVRDFYPADWATLQAVFDRIRTVLQLSGYEEYNASPLERAELYETKTSEEIVGEQTYSFTDRGDRRVTLRPEMTPTLARMIAAKRRELPYPLRWFTIGNRFRYERPQRGRLREFYQADIDLVGAPEGEADGEILTLVSDILTAFGAQGKDFVIRINSRALLNAACTAAGIKGDHIRAYLRLLDKKAKITPEEFATAARAIPAHDPLSLMTGPDAPEPVATEKKKLLDRIAQLKERGVTNVVFDPSVTRGFDYYTGMVFEVFDTDLSNPRAMFGGGRYDGLMSLFGAEPLPAIGFALGDVTLVDFLETHNLLPQAQGTAQLYLATPNPGDISGAQSYARALRSHGVRVFVNLTDKGLGEQVKDAVKRGIPYFAAYGAEEVTSGTVRLKTLASLTEESVSVAELASRLR